MTIMKITKIKKQDVKEIYNFIKNEIILKYILNKVIHLQPDNYVNFFSGKKINYIQPKEKRRRKKKKS